MRLYFIFSTDWQARRKGPLTTEKQVFPDSRENSSSYRGLPVDAAEVFSRGACGHSSPVALGAIVGPAVIVDQTSGVSASAGKALQPLWSTFSQGTREAPEHACGKAMLSYELRDHCWLGPTAPLLICLKSIPLRGLSGSALIYPEY